MYIKAICLFLFSGLLFSIGLFAQEKIYYGHVYDDNNQPLAGVIVSIHDSDTKTVTDESGYFEITIPANVNTVYVEHQDMKPSSASVGLGDVIDVYMVSKSSDAMAEMSLEELMNIDISIASTKADKILTSVSTVTVIDRKTLDSYQFENIQEAIQTVSGVEIYRTYLKRNLATSRGVLQDHYANKVLVMVNNIPMWHAVTGEGCLDRININDVERIEVLKGPASVLYGTNAYSGAINIVLKEKADYTNSSYAKAGSNGLLGAGSHVLLSNEERTLFLSANIQDEEGYEYNFTDEGGNTNTLKEFMNTRNITGVIKDKHTSFFINYYEAEESYFGVTPTFSAGAGNPHNLKGFSSNVKTAYELATNFSLNYSFTYDWNNRDLSRSADDNIRAVIDGYRTNNILSFSYNFMENINVEAGGNWEFRQSNKYANYNVSGDSVLTDNNMKGIDVNAYSAFGQLNFSSEKFNITLGSRFTHNELFKNNLSSRATVVFKAGPKSSLKFIYGESFRAPSLFEQNFTTTSFTVVGNPNLKPETSKSIELSYLKQFQDLFIQLNAYHAIYYHKIFRAMDYYAPALDSVNIYTNGETFSANGVEAELKYYNPQLVNVFLNYALILGNDKDKIGDHYNFKYFPKSTLSLGVSKSYRNFSASAVTNFKSATEGPVSSIDASYKVDLNVSYKHIIAGKEIKHTLSIKNITDSDYSIPEYVRLRTVNEIPLGHRRSIFYTLRFQL